MDNSNLDLQPVPIVGEYLTVSSVQSWLIRQDHGETVTVKLGRLSENEVRGLGIGMRVRIDAIMKIETTSGGAVKTTYTAQVVHRLDGEPGQ